MILAEISDYIRERQRVSVADVANRFDSAPEVVRTMLDVLERNVDVLTQAPTAVELSFALDRSVQRAISSYLGPVECRRDGV